MQFLSEKMCRFLSSLASGFEGHFYHAVFIYCQQCVIDDVGNKSHTHIVCGSAFGKEHVKIICPAWQVEDVLIRVDQLFGGEGKLVGEKLALYLGAYQTDIAYQKIEEYLWELLNEKS